MRSVARGLNDVIDDRFLDASFSSAILADVRSSGLLSQHAKQAYSRRGRERSTRVCSRDGGAGIASSGGLVLCLK